MKRLAFFLLAAGFAATPALAQKVTIDYAHDYDFSKVKTFAYQDTKETNATDELMDGRIRDAIIQKLTDSGLRQVDADPDIYVTYHQSKKDEQVFNTMGYGYGGWGPGWGGWRMGGMGGSTTTETTYVEGTLVVDGYDSTDKTLVWRGSGTVTLKSKPEKVTQQIDMIISKLGQKWQKILANNKKSRKKN